jgi:hypothetical protein
MTMVVLRPHPDGAETPVERIVAQVTRSAPGRLSLRYVATGGVIGLRIPQPASPDRVDELWRHTCFEAFLSTPGGHYWEVNLSPSSQWAAYAFGGYRERVADPRLAAPAIAVEMDAGTLILSAEVDLSKVAGLDPAAPWTLGLSAVIEDKAGERSYWALAHPPGKPDFHHASAFTLHLPPPDRP